MMTLRMTTLSITIKIQCLIAILWIVIMMSVKMLRVVMLKVLKQSALIMSVYFYCNAEFSYAECC
jgi:hypothetical protein